MKKVFAVLFTILAVVGIAQLNRDTRRNEFKPSQQIVYVDTCCALTLQDVITNGNELSGDNTIYSDAMINFVSSDNERESNTKIEQGSFVSTSTGEVNKSKLIISYSGIASLSSQDIEESLTTTFLVFPNLVQVSSQDSTFAGIKEQGDYSTNRCQTCYVTLSELNAKMGVAVSNATDSTDVVTQFNALLQSLRDAGLIAE